MNTEVEGWSHSCELQIIGKCGGYPYCEYYTWNTACLFILAQPEESHTKPRQKYSALSFARNISDPSTLVLWCGFGDLPAFLVVARCQGWGLFLKLLTLLCRFHFSIMCKRCWAHFCSWHVEVTWLHVPLFNIISKKISNCWGRPNHHHRNRDCGQDIVIRGQEELNRRRGRGRRRRTTWLSNLQGR